jgi:hypothetical protein
MFLLIQNVLLDSKTGFTKLVELVKKVISEIISCDEGKELAKITVEVISGGCPQDPHSSSAYLKLAHEIKTLDNVPQPNLLMDWMNALIKFHSLWEVVWGPQKKGKDH